MVPWHMSAVLRSLSRYVCYKREHASFLRDLFIWGDVHYNAFGYELIARDLIADYEKRQVRERNDTSFVHIRQAQ